MSDAVRVRLIEIGEAIPDEVLRTEPETAWHDIARMRDRLAHRDFDTEHSHVAHTVTHDVAPLEAAVARIAKRNTGPT